MGAQVCQQVRSRYQSWVQRSSGIRYCNDVRGSDPEVQQNYSTEVLYQNPRKLLLERLPKVKLHIQLSEFRNK